MLERAARSAVCCAEWLPSVALAGVAGRIPPRSIPWKFVDVIETDPARRVKLKISSRWAGQAPSCRYRRHRRRFGARRAPGRLSNSGRRNRGRSAGRGRTQGAESRSSSRSTPSALPTSSRRWIPGPPPTCSATYLKTALSRSWFRWNPQAQQEVVELLEHKEETAAGRMTTEFLALPVNATVQNAIDSLREFEGGVEVVSTIYLVDSMGTLVGAVPLARSCLRRSLLPCSHCSRSPWFWPTRERRKRGRGTVR